MRNIHETQNFNLKFKFKILETDEKKKAPYIGNSTATYYRKYGPTGAYTKAAKNSLPITQYFNKQTKSNQSEKEGLEKDSEREGVEEEYSESSENESGREELGDQDLEDLGKEDSEDMLEDQDLEESERENSDNELED